MRARFDLGHTNIDRVSQETWDQAVVDRDREAAITLDRLLAEVETKDARAASIAEVCLNPER